MKLLKYMMVKSYNQKGYTPKSCVSDVITLSLPKTS